MSDAFYSFIKFWGYQAFWVSSRPVILHRERVNRDGAFLLASNHLSPFDVPLLVYCTRRRLDFVSIVEVFRNPFVAWFYSSFNAFPLDRSRPDAPTVRVLLDRLKRGRVVAMFPEGYLRTEQTSVLAGGPFKPGVARLAQLADVPVVPAVVVNSGAYRKVKAWMPLKRIRWGANFGEPLTVRKDLPEDEARTVMLEELRQSWLALHNELLQAMGHETEPQGSR